MIVDLVPTPDPEMDIDEIERSKARGDADEDDFYRDMTLKEVLCSITDETEFSYWGTIHA
jgi:hypothetical protein